MPREISQNSDFDILIHGGGPVALACAAWCLQKLPELSLVLLDRNPINDEDISNGDSRGIALSHGSKILLNTIHAWPTDCADIHRIHVSQAGKFGRALMTREELNQEALGHIIRYRDIQLTLRKSLRNLMGQSPNFKWQHIDRNQEEPTISAKCIIHAEGGLFNHQEWIESGRDYHQSALVGLVEVENAPSHQAWERFTAEGPLALLPSHLGKNILNLVWCGSPATSLERLHLNDDAFLKRLQVEFGFRMGRFLNVQERRLYELGLNYRKILWNGNEVWIGNAAQTLHPVAGQGLNLGLRDAYLLSENLSTLFSRPEKNRTLTNIQESLEQYALSRKIDREITIGITDVLARIFTTNIIPVALARGIALSALQWLPMVKTSLARQMMFGRR